MIEIFNTVMPWVGLVMFVGAGVGWLGGTIHDVYLDYKEMHDDKVSGRG